LARTVILIVVSAKNMDFDKLVSVMGIIDMPLVSVRKCVTNLEAAGGRYRMNAYCDGFR